MAVGALRAGGASIHGPEINQTEDAVVTSASSGQDKVGNGRQIKENGSRRGRRCICRAIKGLMKS